MEIEVSLWSSFMSEKLHVCDDENEIHLIEIGP